MPEFVQIEKSELEEIFSRMSYLKKVFITFFERVRNKEPDDWLTLQELCEFLHISESKSTLAQKERTYRVHQERERIYVPRRRCFRIT